MVKRQPLLPQVLSVTEGATVCRKPFKPPCSKGYDDGNDQLARRLSARRRFVPWGGSSSAPFVPVIEKVTGLPNDGEKDIVEESVTLPPGIDPLVLWQPDEFEDGDVNMVQIVVDPLLVLFLRPHQRYSFGSKADNHFVFLLDVIFFNNSHDYILSLLPL